MAKHNSFKEHLIVPGSVVAGEDVDFGYTLASTRTLVLLLVHWSESVTSLRVRGACRDILAKLARWIPKPCTVDIHEGAKIPDCIGAIRGGVAPTRIAVATDDTVHWEKLSKMEWWQKLALSQRKGVLGRIRECSLEDALCGLRKSQRGEWLMSQISWQFAKSLEDAWAGEKSVEMPPVHTEVEYKTKQDPTIRRALTLQALQKGRANTKARLGKTTEAFGHPCDAQTARYATSF